MRTGKNLLQFLLIFIHLFGSESYVPGNEPPSQLRKSTVACYECSAIVRFVYDSTHCSKQTLVPSTVKSCSPNMFCYVKITTPDDLASKTDTLLRRGCTEFSINSCTEAHNKNGVKFTQCIKSCSGDYCNSQDIIEFGKPDNNTQTICPGNGQISLWKSEKIHPLVLVFVSPIIHFLYHVW